jgi:hypothetical protein
MINVQLAKTALCETINLPTYELIGLSEGVIGDKIDYTMEAIFEKVAKMYNMVDFSTIEKSKGNIDKFKYIKQTEASIDKLKLNAMVHGNKDVLKYIEALYAIVNGLRANKNAFSELYSNPLVKMLYNSSVYNVLYSINIIYKEFYGLFLKTKSPEDIRFKTFRSGSYLTLKNSLELAEAYRSDIPKLLEETKKSAAKKMNEMVEFDNEEIISVMNEGLSIFIGAALFLVALRIVPIIREIIYSFYHLRISVDNTIEIQNELISINIESLEVQKEIQDSKGQKKMNKIIEKQRKIVKKLSRIQEIVAIKTDIADNAVNNQIRTENEEIKRNLSSVKGNPSQGASAEVML